MKRITEILIAALSLSVFAIVSAQQPQPAPDGSLVLTQARIYQGPEGPPLPPPPADFVFMASESFGGKVVKGAPYSAEAVTETIQTLADGNRIVNKLTTLVYRDSEGRTRREQTLKGLGGLGTSEEPLQMIFINDPVAGVTYSLDSRTHVAHKSVPFTFEFTKPGGAPAPAGEGERFEFKVAPGAAATAGGANVIVTAPAGAPSQARAGAGVGVGVGIGSPDVQYNVRTDGVTSYVLRTRTGSNANEVKEQLGKQIIEGVEAEGTRTTVTIPAGEIGNERAIEIVSERWYSPELQLVVMTRNSDPRTGETTYKLTNINRTEPAKSLFEVPSGFTIKEGMHVAPTVAPMPRKKANPE